MVRLESAKLGFPRFDPGRHLQRRKDREAVARRHQRCTRRLYGRNDILTRINENVVRIFRKNMAEVAK